MGMTVIKPPKIRRPLYKNTLVCSHCDAEYAKDKKWIMGYYPGPKDNTSSDRLFIPLVIISPGQCPLCQNQNLKGNGKYE